MKWTLEQIEILKSNLDKTDKEMALILNKGENAIKLKRCKLGYKKINPSSKWTQEEIDILIEKAPHLSSFELLTLLPLQTINSIKGKCKKLKLYKTDGFWSDFGKKYLKGCRKTIRHYKLDQNLIIDDITYQVLIGSMLGDGGITKNCAVNVFKETHGTKQLDYLEWKRKMLSIFQPNNISRKEIAPIFNTPYHPIFDEIRKEWYDEEKKRKSYIPPKCAERLDELGLLVWYLDDGDKGRNNMNIASSLFNNIDESLEIINRNLGLTLYSTNKKTKPGRLPRKNIYISAANRDILVPKWRDIFVKYDIPECMKYKLDVKLKQDVK